MVLAGGAVAVVVAIILARGGKDEPANKDPGPEKPAPNVGWSNERVQAVVAWTKAVVAGDRVTLATTTDLDAFQRHFALGDQRPVSTMSGDDRTRLKDEILDALLTREETKVLREFVPYGGRIVDPDMADAGAGKVSLDVSATDAVRDKYVSEGTVELAFTSREGRYLVSGYAVTSAPREKVERVKKTRPKHDTIAKPEIKKVMRGDKEVTVAESQIVPLDHLADTPPDLRAEIDRLIDELVRPGALPRELTKVRSRLREIGKPAVPRLLTRFNDIKTDTPDGIVQLTQLDALLRDMSGRAFGFSPADNTVLASPQENEEARLSALRQWYGWWYLYHDKPLDIAFDKEEDLFTKPKATTGSDKK